MRNMRVSDSRILQIFNAAQGSLSHHGKLAKSLQHVQAEYDNETFQNNVHHLLSYSLIVSKREPAVERTIDFIARFATLANKSTDTEKKSSSIEEDDNEEVVMDPFLLNLFSFLLDYHGVKDRVVRFRVCQLIGKLLHFMDDEDAIDEELGDRIYDCMMTRLRDKFPNVRAQAVIALARLQDPIDSSCPIVKAYVHLMANDSSPEVRKVCICYTAVTTVTLEPIIERTRDANDSVRKAAYQVLGEKVNIKALSIAQRLQILHDGLNDRSSLIQKFCSDILIKKWLASLGNSVYNFLECLHVESSPDISEQTLKAIFQDSSHDELKNHIAYLKSLSEPEDQYIKICEEKLSPEAAIYWRTLCHHINSSSAAFEDLQGELLSEPIIFCDYVLSFGITHLESIGSLRDSELELESTSEFIFKQLLLLVEELDLTDEVGRKAIQKLVRKSLLSERLPSSLIGQLIKIFWRTVQEEEKFTQNLVEIISDIKEPMTETESLMSIEDRRAVEVEIGKVKVRLHEEMEILEKALAEERYQDAAGVKERMKDLEEEKARLTSSLDQSMENQSIRYEKDDVPTVHKCLIIAAETLKFINKKKMTSTMKTLVQTLVWPSVQNEDPVVREAAVHCLGLCSLLDKNFATQHLVLFLQVSQIDHEIVQLRALQVLFDLLLVYGLDAFNVEMHSDLVDSTNLEKTMNMIHDRECPEPQENENSKDASVVAVDNESESLNSAKSVLSILTAFFDSESAELRTVVVEGMAKLLLAGRIQSAKLFSRLVLLWYNPAVSDDFRLRHCVGVFLPMFAFASRSHQEVIEEAFLPIVDTLFNAPDTSPLSAVNVNNVIELLVHLTDSSMLHGERKERVESSEGNLHESLAERVANDILTDVSRPQTKTLCRVLTLLDLTKASATAVDSLLVLCERLVKEVDDAGSLKYVEKVRKTLNSSKPEDRGTQPTGDNGGNDGVEEMSKEPIVESEEEAHTVDGDDITGTVAEMENMSIRGEEDPCTPRGIRTAKSKQDKEKAKKKSARKTGQRARTEGKSTVRAGKRTRKTRMIISSEEEEEPEDMCAARASPMSVSMRISSVRDAKNSAVEKTRKNLESMLNDSSDDEFK